MRGIALLGSTGSIGTTALRVLDRQRDRFRVAALTAFANTALLEQQASRFQPSFVGLVRNGTDHDSRWRTGEGCLVDAATREDVDIVLNAVVGAAPLRTGGSRSARYPQGRSRRRRVLRPPL